MRLARCVLAAAVLASLSAAPKRARVEAGPDAAYTAKIREYTTEPFFSTELVDHLPASSRVPAPDKVLGHIIGAPDHLTYTKDIYNYLRELERASPRVRVFTIGHSEEGREMLMVAVSDESNIRKLDRYRQITAQLADPRKLSTQEAQRLINEGLPFYWATGSIHSPETGSPEMIMELAYRLAVENTPLVENIRKNSIVLLTPTTEVDGHDREVDVYNYHKAFPNRIAPNLVYWGKYVAHDNNRDAMGMALALSRDIMKTFLEWHPQVLHDLHESEPFLYVSTGMGPYNAWLDPITVDEWQKMAYVEVEQLTRRGVPGVWTHGFYDGWAPNYMFYAANGHNAIGRFYETFGGVGADTRERTIPAAATTRTWYRPNPPLAKVKWSLRDNINLQESGLLLAMDYTARNRREFLENFYIKSKRSIEKARKEGPAAWVIPSDDPRPGECAGLVNLLEMQGVEVHRSDGASEVGKIKIPAGSYVIRMDQPYSRMADMMLDKQYYNVSDPRPYDDTGWSLGPLRNIKTIRVTDTAILDVPMTLLTAPVKPEGGIEGPADAAAFAIANNTEGALATLRFRLHDLPMFATEAPFENAGKQFPTGSFVITNNAARDRLAEAAADLGIAVHALAAAPQIAMHPLAAPRVALVHTWLNTQNEGWYRVAFDRLQIPYEYISDQKLRIIPDLREKYDVIIFGPTPGNPQRVVNGIPMHGGDPIPWKESSITPNLGSSPDTTDDMRGGMGLEGLDKIAQFVNAGGLFVVVQGNAGIPIDYGLVEGVSIVRTRELQAHGSVLDAVIADKNSPVAYGYGDRLAVYFNQAPVLEITRPGSGFADTHPSDTRPSGRGGVDDPDVPQGRPYVAPPPKPVLKPGEEPPLDDDVREYMRAFLPTPETRPRVILRFAAEKELLVSGMLSGGKELANKPAIIDVPKGKGHVLLFANNPVWRNETQGSYFLLFNALLNYDHLNAGRTATAASATTD